MATSTLLSQTVYGTASGNYDGSSTTFASDKQKGDGYYSDADGLHTVSFSLTSFKGVIQIQGTLATTPTESDWFNISGAVHGDGSTVTSTDTFKNFTGNFVWIRAQVTDFGAGTINSVILSA